MFFDTSVLVPAVVDQLANHEAAFEAFLNHTASPHRAYCSTHALAECYATMTNVRDFERCRPRGPVVTAP